MARKPKPDNPFRWFDSSPEVIQLVVMLYVRYPLSLRRRLEPAALFCSPNLSGDIGDRFRRLGVQFPQLYLSG